MEPYATAAGRLRTWTIIVNATSVETETLPRNGRKARCAHGRSGLEARVAAAREAAASRTSYRLPGGHSEWEPPDPIPNSEVKTLCADGSVLLRACQSRSLPGF